MVTNLVAVMVAIASLRVRLLSEISATKKKRMQEGPFAYSEF